MDKRNVFGKQAGISVVEMLVALALGLILVLGVVQLFTSSKRTYQIQDAAARLQEDGRYVLTRMSQELRMAGMFGCLAASNIANRPAAFDDPIEWYNGTVTLRIVTSNATRGVGTTTNADWTLVTDCRTNAAVQAGVAAPGAGQVALPVRLVEYRFDADAGELLFRGGGAGAFTTLMSGVQSMNVSFGLAAAVEDSYVSGNYVAGAAVPNPELIRSVRIEIVLEDADGLVSDQPYSVAVALRNRSI